MACANKRGANENCYSCPRPPRDKMLNVRRRSAPVPGGPRTLNSGHAPAPDRAAAANEPFQSRMGPDSRAPEASRTLPRTPSRTCCVEAFYASTIAENRPRLRNFFAGPALILRPSTIASVCREPWFWIWLDRTHRAATTFCGNDSAFEIFGCPSRSSARQVFYARAIDLLLHWPRRRGTSQPGLRSAKSRPSAFRPRGTQRREIEPAAVLGGAADVRTRILAN